MDDMNKPKIVDENGKRIYEYVYEIQILNTNVCLTKFKEQTFEADVNDFENNFKVYNTTVS
jgi:hypothetical protein